MRTKTRPTSQQSGFTLMEIVVTISLLSILMAMSSGALTYYLSSRAVETSAAEIQSEIREAQALAVATGNTYRIDFSGDHAYTLLRRQGSQWVNVRGPINLESAVYFSSLQSPDFGGDRYLDFYARGTCEGGSVLINGRFGKTKMLTVVAETVNVSIS